MKSRKPKLKALSLYTGAGGFDVGLEAAGISIVGAVESDETCRSTLKLNRPAWKLSIKRDIHDYSAIELRKEFNLKRKELAILSAGPPCQPFSKSSFWNSGANRRMRDPRAKTLSSLISIVNELLPCVVLIENVEGIAFVGRDDGLRFILKGFEKVNRLQKTKYIPQIVRVNAAQYGVPQLRERLFIVAIRNGLQLNFPPPRFKLPDDKISDLPLALTAGEALGVNYTIGDIDRVKLSGKWADLIPSIPAGQNYLYHTKEGGGQPIFNWRSRYWSFLLKLSPDKPSWTIQAQPGSATGPFHWDNRKLTIEELACLQTFPQGYRFCGSYSRCVKQIGNAVPSAIGELFGKIIRKQVFKDKVSHRLKLLPKPAKQIPSSPRLKPVSQKYLQCKFLKRFVANRS